MQDTGITKLAALGCGSLVAGYLTYRIRQYLKNKPIVKDENPTKKKPKTKIRKSASNFSLENNCGDSMTSLADDESMIEYRLYEVLEGYPILKNNRTILARHLTRDIYDRLGYKTTPTGYTLDECIQVAIDHPSIPMCGLLAGDEQCYEEFAEIFDPVITDWHFGYRRGIMQHSNRLQVEKIEGGPLDPRFVKATHFMASRCLTGFRFPVKCGRAERREIERVLKQALQSLKGDWSGQYVRLCDFTPKRYKDLPEVINELIEKPKAGVLLTSGTTKDWPDGRGLWISTNRKLYAWTNREEHLRLLYYGQTVNAIEAYNYFAQFVIQIEQALDEEGHHFASHKDYGYLVPCPSGIGTALNAAVQMKLQLLVKDRRFRDILQSLRLQLRYDYTKKITEQETIKLFNVDVLGCTEEEIVENLISSTHILCRIEEFLANGGRLKDSITKNPSNILQEFQGN